MILISWTKRLFRDDSSKYKKEEDHHVSLNFLFLPRIVVQKRSARKKEPDYDEDENQVEEEETKELNHFWAGSNTLISHTMPLI
jgi:hypothetical protein